MTGRSSALRRALAAGAFYAALVFAAGFALGAVRTLMLEPRFGAFGAVRHGARRADRLRTDPDSGGEPSRLNCRAIATPDGAGVRNSSLMSYYWRVDRMNIGTGKNRCSDYAMLRF